MLVKVAVFLLLAVIVWRWALGTWPWDGLFEPPGREAELARARQLLGVGRRAGADRIVAAHRRLIARVHPDRGGSAEAVHAANAARDLLLAELGDGSGSGRGRGRGRAGSGGDASPGGDQGGDPGGGEAGGGD